MLKLLTFIGGLSLLLPFYGAGQSDTLNQTDKAGLKQGYWIVYGADKPDKEYCDTCKIEEGNYIDNRKYGIWKKYFKDGKTVRLQGTYERGRPNGHYIKYYENGCIREEGDFLYKKTRSYKKYSEDCMLEQERFYDENGKEIKSVFYFPNSCKQLEKIRREQDVDSVDIYRYSGSDCNRLESHHVEYVGPLVTKCWLPQKGDTRLVIKYEGDCDYFEILDTLKNGHHEIKDSLGRVIIDAEIKDGWIEKGMMYCWNENGESLEYKYKNKSVKDFKRIQPNTTERDTIAPSGEKGKTKNGKEFNPEGYNKLYNEEDELWLDGNFKTGRLFDGKEYVYDSDGILTKIKIFKNGKYHSDGVLN